MNDKGFKLKILRAEKINKSYQSNMSLCELPSEILIKIFSVVEGDSVFVLPRICRRWRVICSTLSVQEIKWKHYPMKIEAFVIMLSKFGRIESLDFDLGKKNSDPVDDLIIT